MESLSLSVLNCRARIQRLYLGRIACGSKGSRSHSAGQIQGTLLLAVAQRWKAGVCLPCPQALTSFQEKGGQAGGVATVSS